METNEKPIEERLLDATFALAWTAGALESAESADSSITRDVQRELLAMALDGRMDHALNLAVLFLAVSKARLSAV